MMGNPMMGNPMGGMPMGGMRNPEQMKQGMEQLNNMSDDQLEGMVNMMKQNPAMMKA